jgi:hypothetical protein
LAAEVLERIGELCKIEHHIHGRAPEKRRAARQEQAVPVLNVLHA